MERKKLVVVGGGYLGVELAKSLDAQMDVTVIERASHFTHAPAMIRAMTSPDLLDKALIRYGGFLKNGRLVKGEAISIDGDGVNLAEGGVVPGDFIVIATGSKHIAPLRTEVGDTDGLRANSRRWNDALTAAGSVLIIGAGAVGTELSGEIAHAYPEKKVTLVASAPSLFPGFPQKLGRSLLSKLTEKGVEVILEARAKSLPDVDVPQAATVELSNGTEIKADLVIAAVGSQPLSQVARGLPGVQFDEKGRLKVDKWMRPSTLPNVFAAGDVADNGDAMTIVAISRQAPWLKKALTSVASGADITAMKPYKAWGKAPILLPLGPQLGASFLGLFTAGNWVTSQLKGKDLFLSKYAKIVTKP